jgi:GNAT superfamily N-acetyltransferase
MRVSVAGEDLDMASGANLHVHPRYRDTFAYTTLVRHLNRTLRERFPLHFSLPSEQTYARQRVVDPDSVVRTPWLLRVLDPAALAQRYGQIPGRAPVAPFVRIASQLAFRTPPAPGEGRVRVRHVPDFDERFDAFWTSTKGRYRVALVRDRAFLNWRFTGYELRSYETFVAETSTGMTGYLVVRRMEGDGVGHIVDLLIAAGSDEHSTGASLIQAAEEHCRAHGVTVMSTALTPSSLESSLLTEAGYRANPLGRINRLGSFWPPPLRCGLFVDDAATAPPAARRARDWYVTLAHHETI